MIEEFKNLKEIQMIIFRLGSEEYAVPIMNVQEIIMKQAPTHIPKSPSWVEGVISLRGHIIPIVDGKKKFSLGEYNIDDNNARIIVMDVEHKIIGLIVDEVSEVLHLKTDDIEPAPIDTAGEDSDFLWGVAKHLDRLLILINPKKFLTQAEADDINRLTKVTEAIKQATEVIESN